LPTALWSFKDDGSSGRYNSKDLFSRRLINSVLERKVRAMVRQALPCQGNTSKIIQDKARAKQCLTRHFLIESLMVVHPGKTQGKCILIWR